MLSSRGLQSGQSNFRDQLGKGPANKINTHRESDSAKNLERSNDVMSNIEQNPVLVKLKQAMLKKLHQVIQNPPEGNLDSNNLQSNRIVDPKVN